MSTCSGPTLTPTSLQEDIQPTCLGPVTSTSLQEDIQPTCSGPTVTPTSLQEDIPPSLPTVRRFIEDDAREWRELDYQIQVVHTVYSQLCHTVFTIFLKVGKPPTSFWHFLRQYDWNIFTADGLTAKVDLIILIWI
jgi:hypothetical protein